MRKKPSFENIQHTEVVKESKSLSIISTEGGFLTFYLDLAFPRICGRLFRIRHFICRCIFSFFSIFNLRKWGTERPNLPLFHKSVINGQRHLWVNKWHHLPNQEITDLRHICCLVISSKETKTEMNTKNVAHGSPVLYSYLLYSQL